MERLEKLINILKLTPHRQPELVKEATRRILSRPTRSDPQTSYFLQPLIEILIKYCDNDDSAQRSIFNDHLNSVVLAFQYSNYQLLIHVLLEIVNINGTARAVTAALQRIAHLIDNVQPIELGCEPQKLIKALIEVARRSDDESVLRGLDLALTRVTPYLDHQSKKSKEILLLYNSLVEVLFRNLQNESSQTKRLAASSIATICSNSELELQNTFNRLKVQLELLSQPECLETNKFAGFCLCVKEIPKFSKQHHQDIIQMIASQIEHNFHDTSLMTSALETLRDLFKYQVDYKIIDSSAKLLTEKFLISEKGGVKIMKQEIKIILQSNTLACISAIVKQRPIILDQFESLLMFKNHTDVAVRNQVIIIIGNYIEASWRFPRGIEQSINCERIRKLWLEIRSILYDETAHPDTLKTCVVAIKSCLNTLLESDHCLHIVHYDDFNQLIQLYHRSNFKPFKIEILNLFGALNYRTLEYLERSHWFKMKAQTAGSFLENLQDRILQTVIITSLVDEHQRVRYAATSALIALIPNLYITNTGQRNTFQRNNDPIVSLAQDLSNEHLVVLKQAEEYIDEFNNCDDPSIKSEPHYRLCLRNEHRSLTSSIIQIHDNPYNEQVSSQVDISKSYHRVNISINLMHVVGLLKSSLEDSLDKGKTAISSLVRTLHELSLIYPIYQHSSSWDCRPSEYCDCFTLLNFILTYLENLTEPDVIVEDLEAYRNFIALSHQLLYALCHESVLNEYEQQRMKPFHKRQANLRDGNWSELTLRHPCIDNLLDVYFSHLIKLLWLSSNIIEGANNPLAVSSKQATSPQQPENIMSHRMLMSNRSLFSRIHKKLESSFKSSKKNLNQRDEKFFQILETCLNSMSSLFEFVGMSKSIDNVKEILGYLKITSATCENSSLICARQLLKSLFGINILALYQVDPNDWFEEGSWQPSTSKVASQQENSCVALQGVYHHLIADPYRIFSSYYSINCSQITPTSDKALSILNFESCRALKVRRRIEERVKSLFEFNPHQLVSPKLRQISEILKNTITEFTPIVTDSMNQFNSRGFIKYQSEILHFMSYLILLRVNYQKLAQAEDLISSINKLLEQCGEKVFNKREEGIETFLRNSFTFLTLLSYERGPSKPMFQVATVIQKLDDLRAKLSMSTADENDIATYVVPLLRCLVEDLFIYRTKHFQNIFTKPELATILSEGSTYELAEQSTKDMFEILEAERETVAQKLLDVIDNPKVYDLLSILILESRQNSSEIKYKKLSQHLLSIIPTMLSKRKVNLMDYRYIELTRRIIENISPEVFQPVNFIFETLLEVPKPANENNSKSRQEFQRWMSLVIISMHILITQVKEEVFLTRLRETMSDDVFVEYLLHIAQLCIAEIFAQLYSPTLSFEEPNVIFLIQQLSSYIIYLTHMFQSGLFFQLSRSATDLIKREIHNVSQGHRSFHKLCLWSRDPDTGFSLHACEKMFYYIKFIHPDITIFWCNVMMLLNNVDCNREFWRDLLVYECHQCQVSESLDKSIEALSLDSSTEESTIEAISTPQELTKDESKFKRGSHINRPSSLNLSDISFSDQLRRSFIKKIATAETRDKAFNRNIIETSDEDGQLLEREVTIVNAEQCLSPNIELTRRAALCLVLDFVTISMNDVEHITWLIIHHINDIIRWSHELPISEFINAVHGNSASSGIFIQAINSGFNDLTSMSFVTRLLWTLQQVHYTQYGSLVVLLIEKLLSSPHLTPYRSLTRNIEEFACATVQRLLHETNKSLVTTNDEVVNQLTADDLDRIYTMLDVELYPNLTKLLLELRESTQGNAETPAIELHSVDDDSEEDSENETVIEILYSKANLVYWLAEQNYTAHISSLLPALNTIRKLLANPAVVDAKKDETLICFLVSAIYSLALNILPTPRSFIPPKFWCDSNDISTSLEANKSSPLIKPLMLIDSKRPTIKSSVDKKTLLSKSKDSLTKTEIVEACRMACLKGLFLMENIAYLRVAGYEHLAEVIIRLSRLPLINSFILTPPVLWRQNLWSIKFEEGDIYKINFPMVTHDILSKDYGLLENFCDRLLELGWTSRRQYEEAWMTLLGVLTSSLSQPDDPKETDVDKKTNLLISCKVVSTITKLLLLARKSIMGDPLSGDSYPSQSFDERVIELTKAIGSNLTSLRKRTLSTFESLELERKSNHKSIDSPPFLKSSVTNDSQNTRFSHYLRITAQKLRMNVILNAEVDMQDTVVIDNEEENSRNENIDVESCIRLLLSIYKQKFSDPNENLFAPSPLSQEQTSSQQSRQQNSKNRPNQLAPPLATAICQSMVALSDMFADYEQFDWLFETFVHIFRLAERNEDELQKQHLIIGLCKSGAVCCYELPNELTTTAAMNHRDVMFEKCRQSLEKCIKSDFGPLKLSSLFGAYYMLEDSINIVASGAWELDHFKQLRQSRLTWILKLMPIILDKENSKLLTKKAQIMKLLESLCEVVSEFELKAIKA